jgi:hypothetical protein
MVGTKGFGKKWDGGHDDASDRGAHGLRRKVRLEILEREVLRLSLM